MLQVHVIVIACKALRRIHGVQMSINYNSLLDLPHVASLDSAG